MVNVHCKSIPCVGFVGKCNSTNTMVIYNVILEHEKLKKSRSYQKRWLDMID